MPDKPLKPSIEDDGYWCVVCNKFLPRKILEDGRRVILHDDVDHYNISFDEEDRPQ